MSTTLSSVGKYQIIEEIGRGGMGAVYKGHDPDLNRTVAIKLLASHLVWEKDFVERFLREARAAARLDHPNIIHIFDVGQTGSNFYFVMTFLPGPSLKQMLRQKGRLTTAQTLLILHQLADALDYAHSKGLVHRDVKSANVMFNELGQAVLTDFGLVKAAQESKLTITGAFLGTPQYMAPEQVQGTGVDARADEYALGVLAFEMLTGQVPFDADTTPAILYKQVNDPPPAVTTLCRDLPTAVESVLSRALAKLPASRYASCGEFVKALEQASQPAVSPRLDTDRSLFRRQRAELRQRLGYYFSEEELRTLCFDLGIDYEALPAQGKLGKARELIAELERTQRLAALVALCRKLRPEVSWAETLAPEPSAELEQEQPPAPVSPPPPKQTLEPVERTPLHVETPVATRPEPQRAPEPAAQPPAPAATVQPVEPISKLQPVPGIARPPETAVTAPKASNRLLTTIGIGVAAIVLVALVIKLSGWLGPAKTPTPPPTQPPAPAYRPTITPPPTPTWTPTSTPTWTPTSTHDKEAKAHLAEGLGAKDKGNWQLAIEQCTQAIELTSNPSDAAQAYFCRGYAHDQRNENQEAIDDYTKVIGLSPSLDSSADLALVELAYLERGLLYANVLNNCGKAIPDLERYLQGPDLRYRSAARTALAKCQ